MSEFVDGTKIPLDPRKRTKNHGRLEITMWVDIPDESLKLGGWSCASDALRAIEDGMKREIQTECDSLKTVPIIGDAKFKVVTRVSQ